MTEQTLMTTIKLEMSTRDRLKRFGYKGDTYDAIVRRLMDEHEKSMGENPWAPTKSDQ